MRGRIRRISTLWQSWKYTFYTTITMICVGVASYTLGALQSVEFTQKPLIVHIPENQPQIICDEEIIHDTSAEGEDCIFVGSKNGTKYYPPDCSAVSRIAPENLICFASIDDAQQRGYERSKSCPTL